MKPGGQRSESSAKQKPGADRHPPSCWKTLDDRENTGPDDRPGSGFNGPKKKKPEQRTGVTLHWCAGGSMSVCSEAGGSTSAAAVDTCSHRPPAERYRSDGMASWRFGGHVTTQGQRPPAVGSRKQRVLLDEETSWHGLPGPVRLRRESPLFSENKKTFIIVSPLITINKQSTLHESN